MKNIVSTGDSVKRQITDSISENLTDSELESTLISLKKTKKIPICNFCPLCVFSLKDESLLLVKFSDEILFRAIPSYSAPIEEISS